MTAVEQPAGEVTLVFSDIEGSTRLLEELGTEAYREALAEHRRIVREACARHAGYEVDYEGDAFFYAFSSAPEAVSAVSEAMAGLEPGPIAIRVGIHTGTPALDPPKYVGIDVHFAARVMSSAHGGQVVCSASTVELICASGSEPRALPLVDLGEHRLKDIAEAVPLFQLGEGRFPPLKTISNTNLPRPASSFLGREHELQKVLGRLEEGARLLTLTGPGGTGKTRLALEVASTLVPAYKAGVFWVGLASLRDPALVTETIAQTLGAKDGLAAHISERELLLLLDNLEQVVECAPELSALLQSCPHLTLLVTSRELLRVRGEVEYPVPPLAQPEAVRLFCERAQAEPSEQIAELCARLDSLPLAVELAAARTNVLSPAQILERLSGRLDLLKGGRDADPRQATLRATIEWSYELLTPAEQQLFARLAVFAGGCTLQAAEEVAYADLDTLQSLLEKSLLRFSNERFWMLETIREYAVERLACFTEADELVRRHAAYYLRAAEELGPSLRGTDQKHLLDAVDKDLENYRAALAHLEAADENAGLLRLSLALSDYWWLRGRPAEGGSWSLRALERNPEPTLLRADALRAASELDVLAGPIARRQLTEAIALCRRFKDRALLARCLNNLGVVELMDGKLDTAAALLEESAALRRREPGQVGLGRTLGNLANLEMRRENFAEAQRLVKESLELGADPFDRAIDHSTLGELALKTHDLSSANVWFCEALRGFAALEARQMIARVLVCLADVEVQRADFDRACTLVAAATQWEEGVDAIEDPDFITERDDVLEALRGSLAERDFELAWNQGRSLSLGETLDLALASLD